MLVRKDIKQFSQSINILRDADREIIYYPTVNSKRIYHQLINDFKLGSHVFNIVGSYGTGKSSFLWALEQNLAKGKPYFAANSFAEGKVEVVRMVGEYLPIKESIALLFGIDHEISSKEIFAKIFYDHSRVIKNGLLLILIDEFGKFLEYASKNDPEKELYFLQEFAEFVSRPEYNIILVTTIHQNFDAYAFGLKSAQRMEWGKVKGRFKEITFNEPVEQLLVLVADHLKQKFGKKTAEQEVLSMEIGAIFTKAAAFQISQHISSDIALDILPLDLFAANVLTVSLQRYGQNERSLFSFLESSDHTSLDKVSRENTCFHLGHVYDYLLFNFYSFIQSKYNPDYSSWKSIRDSLDELQRRFDTQIEDYSKLLKTIGLLHLNAANGSNLDESFLIRYAKLCLGINEPAELIAKLKANKMIIYREHLQRYALNEGTSLDVEAALILAAGKVDQINDVASLLKRYYALPPVLAKNYAYEMGTPRIFEFVITDKLKIERPSGELDGFIYLIFNEQMSIDQVLEYSGSNREEPVIYVFYENSRSIKDLLFELEKLRKVMEENSEDKVAVRLLNESLEASQKALNYFILGALYSGSQNLSWVWNGKIQKIGNKRSFNQLLSVACKTAYASAPIFNNELANKHKVSTSISTARKSYFRTLVGNWNIPDLGFEKEKFPPEKTIYLSLLKENKISVATGQITLSEDKNNIMPLWKVSEEFLDSSRERRKAVSQLIETLSNRPFKLKQGLISFWIPTFLFIKRDEFALFGENGYIPFLTEETLDLLIRYPEKYEVKAFDLDVIRMDLFNQYRTFLQQSESEYVDNQTFIDTIRPFLTFYRQLPYFVKNTKTNLSKEAIALRNVISSTEDLERTFFDDFPNALGYSQEQLFRSPELAEAYIAKLQLTVREIRTCFELLVDRFEELIKDRIVGDNADFNTYRSLLVKRYKKLKPHLIKAAQKTFLQRAGSNIDDRKAWLNSIAQILVGKPLESFDDVDEFLLKDRFSSMISELDSLSELASSDFDEISEDVMRFEINNFIDGVNKTVVRMPKNKRADIARIEDKIRSVIGDQSEDSQLSIVALANVIKKLMEP